MDLPRSQASRSFLLVLACVAPPTAWFLHLNASYGLAAYACAPEKLWLFHTWTALALLVALVGVVIGWYFRRAASGASDDQGAMRARFIPTLAVLLGALSALVIVTQGLVNTLLHTCQ